ncbi:MAG: portal protein [Methanobrevibacter sp.]|nr:portal protein [Methanobrevibacter sp.]MBO7695174.1 portal protein [Methanobrevibacter sp.]
MSNKILENGINQEEVSAFVDAEDQYGKKIKSMPRQEQEIGIDTKNTFFDNIINAGLNSKIDISEIESFTQASQNRNLIYDLLDSMCEDPTISAVLETYAEDATEYNDNGQIVWCESSNSEIANYVSYLLETMNVDKNIYKWVHSLCKYGDLYLRLYRKSDYKDDPIFKDYNDEDYEKSIYSKKDDKKALNEDIKVIAYSKNDKYVHYIEMCPNPAELFELTKFGKTHGFIKAESMTKAKTDNIQIPIYQYKFKQKDIEIFDAKTFVHACLEDNSSRIPEEVDIFLDEDKLNSNSSESSINYTVRRGQSLFYNVFKIWRELMLLENSILLNRLTKSSITRVIGVEVGDMPKEQVGPHLQGIKNLIEQKSAINVGKSMTDYTNPGPIENNIYVPTHNGIGALSTQQVGGDVDVKSLADVDYFKNKFWGSVRIPKMYFGDTDDAAGFSGGESLSLISSRYAKMIKRIQNTIIQAITDVINLMLIDKGFNSYVNEFTIKMQPPSTAEEKDRRENLSNKIGVVSDIMNLLGDVEDTTAKLKILKSLLSNVLTDPEVTDIIQEEIDRLENDEEFIEDTPTKDDIDSENINFDLGGIDVDVPSGGTSSRETNNQEQEEPESSEGELPSPEELGMDMTNNNNPEFD